MDLTDLNDIKNLLRKHGLWTKKWLGQNFLVDRDELNNIVAAAEIDKDDLIVEIGPGLGVMTQELAKKAKKVIAVELDEEIIPILKETTKQFDNIEIKNQDVLKFQAPEEDYKIVANIPYYITSKILKTFLEKAPNKPKSITILSQREVAEQIIAEPGDLTVLAVSVQVFGQANYVKTILANSFYPAPKVNSAILHIDLYDKPKVKVDLKIFFQVLKAGFSQRRKKLRNSIGAGLQLPAIKAARLLEGAQIDPSRRAQELSLKEWEALTERYLELVGSSKQ